MAADCSSLVVPGAIMVAMAACAMTAPQLSAAPPGQLLWQIDSLERIGNHPVTVIGQPKIVETDHGRAIQFNGATDGLVLDVNPLQDLDTFTIEVVFRPDVDGPEEQRFVHFEENASGNRALVELRRLPEGSWSLDTFLRHGQASLTLLDRARTHASGNWHVAALTFDGRTMAHYVDGVLEQSGQVAFKPLGAGRMSIGVRLNRVSWFKGVIRTLRITPGSLPQTDLLQIPSGYERPRQVIPIWPEGVPGAKPEGGDEYEEDGRVYNVQHPTLTYVPPTAPPTGTAVIVCPGGGYTRLAVAIEAEGAARVLASLGVSTFILKYRLKEYGFPAPLQDVLRSVRLLRNRATGFGLDPGRIGVFGASAGGHVAAMAATLFNAAEGRTAAPLDATSGRPDFVALLYPVITMKDPFVNRGSRDNLLGTRPSPALVDRLSLDTQVSGAEPPTFIVHTVEDKSVPVENSLAFFHALRRAGVAAELHVYEKGAHGFGFAPGLGPTSDWPRRLEDWMRSHGWLTAATR